MSKPKVLAVIPARGSSAGIPRKNVRFIADRPLVSYIIETAQKSEHIDHVIISTDDDEVSHIAEVMGAQVLMRPSELCGQSVTLGPVIHHAVNAIEDTFGRFDTVITLEPTSPLLTARTIDKAVQQFHDGTADTLISAVDDRDLAWTRTDGVLTPLYAERVNRQYLPTRFRETGGFVITRRACVTRETRIGSEIDLYELRPNEAVDISSHMDWWIAEKLLGRKRIIFRADGYSAIGMGHIYRTLMLAGRLIDHDLLFVTQAQHRAGADMIENYRYAVRTFETHADFIEIIEDFGADIIINDILDTDAAYIQELKSMGLFVVNFEDTGNGASHANVVINALYENEEPSDTIFWGKDYYCLREEFLLLKPRAISPGVERILVTFGGTDSNRFTPRILTILDGLNLGDVAVTVVTGPGYLGLDELKTHVGTLSLNVDLRHNIKNISKYMHAADLIFSSAGRTIFEVASLGTPMIVMAQNPRELHHTFAREENGIVNLGLGTEVLDADIEKAIMTLVNDVELRQHYHRSMLNNHLRSGTQNVLDLIFGQYEAFAHKDTP